jgi:hypothetical protein
MLIEKANKRHWMQNFCGSAHRGESMIEKLDILTIVRGEFNRWEDLLSGLSEEQITAANFIDALSIKDVIAHLKAWQQRSVARMEAARQNREPEFPQWPPELNPEQEDVDAVNAWIYETHRDQSWVQVHRDWREGFIHFLELGEIIPENDLLDAGRYPWMDGYPLSMVLTASYEHHQEHLVALLELLGKR